MNNYKQIRLSHYVFSKQVSARFVDGNGNGRRYRNVTPSSVERLQNAVINAVNRAEFAVRLPINYKSVGWVAYPKGD